LRYELDERAKDRLRPLTQQKIPRFTPSTIVVLRKEDGRWSIGAVIPPPLTLSLR